MTKPLPEIVSDLIDKVGRLERRRSPRHYTTADRPDAAEAKGSLIFNTTTSTHQASDGTTWRDLY